MQLDFSKFLKIRFKKSTRVNVERAFLHAKLIHCNAESSNSRRTRMESRFTSERTKRRPVRASGDRSSRSHQLFRPMNFTLVKPTPYGRFSLDVQAPLKSSHCRRYPVERSLIDTYVDVVVPRFIRKCERAVIALQSSDLRQRTLRDKVN